MTYYRSTSLPIDIKELLEGEVVESSRIEYKSGWNPNSIIHSICAFANDIDNMNGGYLIIGVDEKDGMPILPPTGIAKEKLDSIQKSLFEKCHFIEPLYIPRIQKYEYEGKLLLVLWIPAGYSRPYKASIDVSSHQSEKAFYIRKGSVTIKADSDQVKELYDRSQILPFDDRENPYASVDDLSLELMREHLKKVGSDLYKLSNNMSKEELARDMGLVRGPKEAPCVNNIGILMFSEKVNDNIFFPDSVINLVNMPEPTGDGMEERCFKGPIQQQLERALTFINSNVIAKKYFKPDGVIETKTVFNYPFNAVKEAIANAVYHRSYQIHEPITVVVTPAYIEIKSFPGFDKTITDAMISQHKIRSFSTYRNRRIGNFLKELHLTEGRNTGIPKMMASMKENGSPEPVFMTDPERTSLIVRLPVNPEFDKGTSLLRLNPHKQRTAEELKKDILTILSSEPMSARRIAKELGYAGVSKAMKNSLDDLLSDSYISVDGSGRWSKYRLK